MKLRIGRRYSAGEMSNNLTQIEANISFNIIVVTCKRINERQAGRAVILEYFVGYSQSKINNRLHPRRNRNFLRCRDGILVSVRSVCTGIALDISLASCL